ncbi:MAG: DedA family protein [Candidatus Diapherotrites archaeon]|nr:DedA family protein [Candidatus Diapherotrites archaeon]
MALDVLLTELIVSLGYLGALLAGFISSATLFLPTPAFIVIFIMAAPQFGFNPLFLGISAGIGAALGEMIGYGIGYGSEKLALNNYRDKLKAMEKYFEKFGGFFVILIFAATPLPFDVVGIFCGIMGYSLRKFIVATAIGKVIKYSAIAYAGFYGIAWLSKLFGLG